MDQDVIARAVERLSAVRDRSDAEAALEGARTGIEALTEATAELRGSLPERIGAEIREGFRTEALPVGRQLAEVRGLQGQIVRRLERLQTDVAAERHARVDDLALLVELVTSGWRALVERLDRLERAIAGPGGEAVVLRLDQRAG